MSAEMLFAVFQVLVDESSETSNATTIYRHVADCVELEFTAMAGLGKSNTKVLACMSLHNVLSVTITRHQNNRAPAEYVDTLIANNCTPVLAMYTRITCRSASLVDHMYYFGG
jgi:hypothetical protein